MGEKFQGIVLKLTNLNYVCLCVQDTKIVMNFW